jgi:hypothetical protein
MIAVQPIYAGNQGVVFFGFENAESGEPVDPTTYSLVIQNGDGSAPDVGMTCTKISEGSYQATFDTTNLSGGCRAILTSDPDGTVPIVCQTYAVAPFVVRPQVVIPS